MEVQARLKDAYSSSEFVKRELQQARKMVAVVDDEPEISVQWLRTTFTNALKNVSDDILQEKVVAPLKYNFIIAVSDLDDCSRDTLFRVGLPARVIDVLKPDNSAALAAAAAAAGGNAGAAAAAAEQVTLRKVTVITHGRKQRCALSFTNADMESIVALQLIIASKLRVIGVEEAIDALYLEGGDRVIDPTILKEGIELYVSYSDAMHNQNAEQLNALHTQRSSHSGDDGAEAGAAPVSARQQQQSSDDINRFNDDDNNNNNNNEDEDDDDDYDENYNVPLGTGAAAAGGGNSTSNLHGGGDGGGGGAGGATQNREGVDGRSTSRSERMEEKKYGGGRKARERVEELETELGTYTGEVRSKTKVPHGRGIMTFKAGGHYDGEFRKGHRHGNGFMRYASGNTYDGQWYKGRKHGHGRFTSIEGESYDGDWVNGKRHGQGSIVYACGDTYNGQWVNDLKEGEGTYTFQESGNRYVGHFLNGKAHGVGKYYYELSQAYYIGTWEMDQRHGLGELVHVNGKRQQLMYERDQFVWSKKDAGDRKLQRKGSFLRSLSGNLAKFFK